MLKVVHVAKFYPPSAGGMERVVESLCTMAPGCLESSVLAFNTGTRTVEERIDGVHVTRVGLWGRAGSVPIAPAFAMHLGRIQADVMVLHEPNPWALLSCIAARPPVPLAIWFHSEVVRPPLQYRLFYAPLEAPIYRRARRFIVSSPELARHARALQPFRSRVAVIPFGIDPAARASVASRARAPAIRRDAGTPLVLFTGRLVPYKGVDVLIRAAAPLPLTLAVVGDGPMRAAWERLAGDTRDRARIIFTGHIGDDELNAWFEASDLVVLPSLTAAEAFGFVQLEAMAAGKAVVSTSVASGVPWVNQHEETGLVVPPGDVAALRAAIARLVADPRSREAMGAAGKRRVAEHFTMQQMADRFVAVCREIAEGAP